MKRQPGSSDNPYRVALEGIVLEAQVRANKAKFQLDTLKGAVDYEKAQFEALEAAYNALQGMFQYIANKYNSVIEPEYAKK